MDILKQVSVNSITKETLREKLAQHILKVDYEMALEYATWSGVNEEPREDIYIESLDEDKNFIDFKSLVFVFRLYH
ncbi:dna topoisomerase 6 subunit b [Nicotiana attenuata]|uniref:Dna topoisomerase 6 subunit b n=1 Tax=Nicotiana attenuata TaxID=49451 RepID=A0A1J6I8U6_NICAT|nr:dna topoisomerase 6 subunit b [Nicotiana attenuata]